MKKLFKKFTMVVISLILANQICFAAGQKRVCIMDLEDKSGEQHSGWHNVGTGIADMMVTALVKTNKFMVIEREKLNKIMEEQQLGASGAITTQTAAKIGQLLGVNYIITGSVTEFGVK
ncbi:hypothetical protein HY745_13925 [Candidatus Desantisbacteria bacterium]|nr:hypothetical protein [Candidatus Desantisbacteria bacterium]